MKLNFDMNRSLRMAAVAAVLGIAALPVTAAAPNYPEMTKEILYNSFQAKGQAGLSRLGQDETNAACSAADTSGKPIDDAVRARIEAENLRTVKFPADGNFMGDWKIGEKIAQSGRGSTWSDKPTAANGGNCYNCHQISKTEVSYGNLGPSLYQYGKLRGTSKEILEYTWVKLYNAKAYNACTNMPRFGHFGILSETQMKHLMALLLDPKSPINQD